MDDINFDWDTQESEAEVQFIPCVNGKMLIPKATRTLAEMACEKEAKRMLRKGKKTEINMTVLRYVGYVWGVARKD